MQALQPAGLLEIGWQSQIKIFVTISSRIGGSTIFFLKSDMVFRLLFLCPQALKGFIW